MIILIMTRWLSVTWWTWTAQHTCLRAPAQQARFDGEEYSMKRNISNIFTYILLNNKPGLPEKNTRCLRHHGKRIHHWNKFFILHHLLDYHQKRRSQGQAKYKMIPPQPDTNTTEGQLMVKELKGARFLIQIYSLWFFGGLFWVSLNLFGLMTLSHLPGASMGDTTLWQGDPTVEGLLRSQVHFQLRRELSLRHHAPLHVRSSIPFASTI